MAYNPNDCVELRWGAAENSDEAATCKRHAPAAQRAKMSSDLPRLVPRAPLADAWVGHAHVGRRCPDERREVREPD